MEKFQIMQGLFVKGVAFIFLIAFASLKVQILGLFGSNGIQPIKDNARQVATQTDNPILNWIARLWYDVSDNALNVVCWIGIGLSLFALGGFYPTICLLLLSFLYFALCLVGTPFLCFQWDVLLIEVGFLAALFAVQSTPPLLFVYLLWFLLFRFMFSSGYTKLIHGSKEWQNLTAMHYHYETQPLPTKLAYYAYKMPKFWGKMSVLGVYFFELIVPVFIFSPPSIRLVVFFLLVFFQFLIVITGNYTFLIFFRLSCAFR